MNRTIGLFMIFAMFALVSCEDEITTSPESFTASQGTFVGVIHLAFSEAYGYGEMNFEIERFNENDATWESIAWIKTRHWDDHDQLQMLPDGIVPGKEYRYRMRAHTSNGGYGEYTPEVAGYAFKAKTVDIEDIVIETDDFDSKHVSVKIMMRGLLLKFPFTPGMKMMTRTLSRMGPCAGIFNRIKRSEF